MESFRDNPMLTTASMPIPSRGRITTDLSEFGFLFDGSNSPSLFGDMGIASTNISLDTMDNSNQTNEMNTTDIKDINTQLWNETPNVISLKSEPFQMDGDDIFQVDESDLIQGPTFAELNELEDLNIDDLYLPEGSIYTNHINLHQLQPAVLSSSMNLPNQILQQNHHGGGGGSYSASNHVQSGIAIGQDVLYDDMTNASSNSFDFGAPSSSSNYNIKNNMINLNSSAITFSPGSHNSSNSSLLYNNSVTPPPPHQQQQQNSSPVSHVPKSPAASSSLTSAFSKQIHHNNKRNNNFLQNNSQQQYSTLHNLLKKEYTSPDSSILGQSVPAAPSGSMLMSGTALSPGGFNNKRSILHQQFHSGGSSAQNSRLSSSAPTHLGLEQLWQRREPRQHLLSTGSLVEAESTSSLSTGGVLSPEAQDFSHDEGYSDDDDDSDHYEDYSSDGDSDNEMSKMNHCNNNSKKERFFWQYNVQAKGPKGQRLVIKKQMEDPHVLNEVTDPVFSPHCSVRGIKHSGKARKGDGNDLTPNPRKLQCIGKELDKLSRIINDMTPVSELPFNARPKTRKEKNKLASRACRLKKKAQHEANKIKLHGLEMEHRRLLNGISQIKQMIVTKCNQSNATEMSGEELVQQLDKINRSATKLKIAGSSTEFVNKILEKIKSGVPRGGLDEIH